MFHTLSLPSFRAGAMLPRHIHLAPLAPLALAGLALAGAMLANAPREASAPPVSAAHPAATLMQSADAAPAILQTAAESLRASLRAVPGVGAVELRGLQTAGVEVCYAPTRLASLGLHGADLLASVPAEQVAPGVIAVRPEAAQNGPASVADMPIHAGRHVMRLGDVALIARTPLPAPVARLHKDGRPAVELVVVPARGSAGPALDRRVARALADTPMPAGIEVK